MTYGVSGNMRTRKNGNESGEMQLEPIVKGGAIEQTEAKRHSV